MYQLFNRPLHLYNRITLFFNEPVWYSRIARVLTGLSDCVVELASCLTLYRSRATILARLAVVQISISFAFSFINGRRLVLDLLITLYKFHSHSIYVQSVTKNFIYQVYENVWNYHCSLRRNAIEMFRIKWLLRDNVKYYIVKLTVFILILLVICTGFIFISLFLEVHSQTTTDNMI